MDDIIERVKADQAYGLDQDYPKVDPPSLAPMRKRGNAIIGLIGLVVLSMPGIFVGMIIGWGIWG